MGLATYGAYALWNQYGTRLSAPGNARAERRVDGRSDLNVTELAVGSDDPTAQATAILAESDARTALPREAPGIEHRRSEDTVEP